MRLTDADRLMEAIDEIDWYHLNNGKMVHGANDDYEQPWFKSNEIFDAIRNAPIVDVPVWIPVKERIPIERQDCLITYIVKSNEESGFTEREFVYEENNFYHFINGDRKITKLYNHKNRYNNPRDIEIFRRLPQGANSLHESIADIMPYKRRNDIFKDKYFKLDESQICKTITSHMKYDCNMYIHPWEARGLGPREAARIQTFPDEYVITGAQNSWYAQVGNAVPVKLAKAIGDGIMDFMK